MDQRGARQERRHALLERRPRPGEARRRGGKARRAKPGFFQQRLRLAQPHPGIGGVEIAGILDPALSRRAQRRLEPGPRHRQQRPQQPALRMLGHRRHAGKPVEAAAARQPQQQGLRLVLAVMRDQKVEHTLTRAPALEQAIARRSRRRLHARPPPPAPRAAGCDGRCRARQARPPPVPPRRPMRRAADDRR